MAGTERWVSLIAAVVDERLKNELSRAGLQDLRGGGFLIAVLGSPLRGSGCSKNSAIVFLEDFQPRRDIGGVFFARLLVKFEIGAQESRSQLGNEFFAAVTFIAPALAAEVTVKALRVFCPVSQFVGESGVIALGVPERFERRHLYII